jgi:LacI family gluconate utilization system Gnt-I transcriptional repressor
MAESRRPHSIAASPPVAAGKVRRRSAVGDELRPSITMAHVARLTGVSTMTVSRVLRDPASVSEETRNRVLVAVDELGYVPNATAHVLSSQRSGFVAVLVPTIATSNFADTARGLTEVLDRHGLQLLLGYTDYSVEREEELVVAMLQRRPEAIVLTGGHHTERTRNLLLRSDIIVVETWDLPKNPIDHVVGFSNAQAAKAMVRHLAGRGYRKIGFVGGATNRDTRGADRRLGYVHAIEELGLSNPRIVTFGAPPISVNQGGAALAQMAEQFPDTDAILCVSDLSAFGALMECHRRGWSVPDRIAIAGFGDFEIAEACHPRLTTVRVDCIEIGRQAGQLIINNLQAIKSDEPVAPITVMTEFTIIQRETT